MGRQRQSVLFTSGTIYYFLAFEVFDRTGATASVVTERLVCTGCFARQAEPAQDSLLANSASSVGVQGKRCQFTPRSYLGIIPP